MISYKIAKKRKKILLFDNCLLGICNMNCIYCRNDSFKRIGEGLIKISGAPLNLNKLERDLKRISLLVRNVFDIPIIKISGYGESFLLPNLTETVRIISENYERTQIITNATLLNKNIISRLSKIPGINICVSLDGHTAELNACRTTSNNLIRKILHNIDMLREHRIPVEVNSVLTKYNISRFVEFIDYLSDRYDTLICYPFPVRGFNGLSVLGSQDAQRLLPLLDSYQHFSHILPHKAYIKRLISFIKEGGRKNKCYVGYSNLGLEPNGNIPICACNIKESIGNIFERDPALVLKKAKSHPLFYKFLFKEYSFKNCHDCFTHYEIINLYLDGTITLKEIGQIPLFNGERTQNILKELKSQLIYKHAEV